MSHTPPEDRTPFPPEIKVAMDKMKEAGPVEALYPWPDMEVGDSVLFQADKGESIRVLKNRIGDNACHYGKMSGKKFEARLVPGKNAFRVWRTA